MLNDALVTEDLPAAGEVMAHGEPPASTIRRRIKPMGVVLAVTSVAAALGVWLALAPRLEDRGVFLPFLFATVVSALYGGFWSGMLALGMSAGLGVLFLRTLDGDRTLSTSASSSWWERDSWR